MTSGDGFLLRNWSHFLYSSYFATERGHKHLPTPAEVTARSLDFRTTPRPRPVKLEHLDLIVKFGPCMVIEEALCLRMLRENVPVVPVPEVYGWKVEEGCVFIYMELIRGETLLDRWDHLSDQERSSVCAQLNGIVSALREVEQDPTDPHIGTYFRKFIYIDDCSLTRIVGSVTRGPLLDYVFQAMPSAGPFKTVKEFNDWFSALPQRWLSNSLKYRDPYREFLPDDGTIKFTHGDLHRGNTISSTAPPRVLAVIDWTHAGWYPDYWEYCEALDIHRIWNPLKDEILPLQS